MRRKGVNPNSDFMDVFSQIPSIRFEEIDFKNNKGVYANLVDRLYLTEEASITLVEEYRKKESELFIDILIDIWSAYFSAEDDAKVAVSKESTGAFIEHNLLLKSGNHSRINTLAIAAYLREGSLERASNLVDGDRTLRKYVETREREYENSA